MKRCTGCGRFTSTDDFTRKSSAPDGIGYRCSRCRKNERPVQDGYVDSHVSLKDRTSFTWEDRLDRIDATDAERVTVVRAAEALREYRRWRLNGHESMLSYDAPSAVDVIEQACDCGGAHGSTVASGECPNGRRHSAMLDAALIFAHQWGLDLASRVSTGYGTTQSTA